jgi:adenylylsulfate reductase subunit A
MRNEEIKISDKQINDYKKSVYQPMENYRVGRNEIVGGTVSPSYLLPIQGLQRLEKCMDEYVGGIGVNYMTNDKLLERGIQLLDIMEEDFEHIGAEDLHQLQRAWELKHRLLTAQSVAQHTLFREETRWPGYYYRGDHMKLDDENWHCLTLSQRDRETGEWTMEKAPVYHIVD